MTAVVAPQVRRRTPPLGGLSGTILGIEIRRVLRNPRVMLFALVLPAAFFLIFGTDSSYRTQSVGTANVTSYVMVSMAVYGALLAATSGGAMVATERALGWSRQLRLTPLRPTAYVAMKIAVAMAIGLMAVTVVMICGEIFGADLSIGRMLACAAIGWLCSSVFAAFGLFMGYLLPSENVMQILGPAMALLSFAGGLFVPVDSMGSVFATIAHFMPTYGVAVLARYPIDSSPSLWLALLNVVVWAAIFVAGAAWRMSRDTRRV
ncbi:ABC transporter permease [Millisia brevis]|uniref:ABC transporter permease n=1 Tax=Millisia brevis TaxID=264148 RepID=UPI0008307F78|nr:ABC transporter permease [Millisia brevis]